MENAYETPLMKTHSYTRESYSWLEYGDGVYHLSPPKKN